MEQGPVEQNIIRQCMREGLALPNKIQNAPELGFGLQLYMGAFLDLNTDRPTGWGPTQIPFSAIMAYADVYQIEGEQREDLLYFVRGMDAAFLDYHSKKNKP